MTPIFDLIGQLARGGAERWLSHLAETPQARDWPRVVRGTEPACVH